MRALGRQRVKGRTVSLLAFIVLLAWGLRTAFTRPASANLAGGPLSSRWTSLEDDSPWTEEEEREYNALRDELRDARLSFSRGERELASPAITSGSASAFEDMLCSGSDFQGGRHADSQIGAWFNFLPHGEAIRGRLFREMLLAHADRELFRIVDNRLFVRNCVDCIKGVFECRWHYPPLIEGLLELAERWRVRLPDVRLVLQCRDGVNSPDPTYPLMVASKARSLKFVLLPNFLLARDLFQGRESNSWVGTTPWDRRVPKAIWRGTLTGFDYGPRRIIPLQQIRVSLMQHSALHPLLLDAACDPVWNPGFAAKFFTEETRDYILRGLCRNGSFLGQKEQADGFRYAVSVDGFGAAFRSFQVLSSGMTPLLPSDNQFEEHFYGLLKPWYHFVPTETWRLHEAVEYLRRHDAAARRIALRAMQFAKRNLRLRPTLCYLFQLLSRFAALQEGLNWNAIEEAYAAEQEKRGYRVAVNGTPSDVASRGSFVPYRAWREAAPGEALPRPM